MLFWIIVIIFVAIGIVMAVITRDDDEWVLNFLSIIIIGLTLSFFITLMASQWLSLQSSKELNKVKEIKIIELDKSILLTINNECAVYTYKDDLGYQTENISLENAIIINSNKSIIEEYNYEFKQKYKNWLFNWCVSETKYKIYVPEDKIKYNIVQNLE